MQAGATTYLTKPLDIVELRTVADKVSQSQRLARSNLELQKQLNERFGFEGVIGNSPLMHSVVERLRQIAPTSATVLITGESGTGKELVAKALHNNSPRRSKPFVALNCAALSENILESELFGHIKGAFTGADRERKGWFEHANGGTMFLDEVGDIPLSTQVKLLRVLESGEIVRVGTNEPVKVNVRLISATNRDLKEGIGSGGFRQDLYHRLKVVSVHLPPLRSRREDITLLTDYFLKQFTASHGKVVTSIAPAARKVLMTHPWPGNVRELKNAIESMVVIDSDGVLDVDDLTEDLAPGPPGMTDPGGGSGQPSSPRAGAAAGSARRVLRSRRPSSSNARTRPDRVQRPIPTTRRTDAASPPPRSPPESMPHERRARASSTCRSADRRCPTTSFRRSGARPRRGSSSSSPRATTAPSIPIPSPMSRTTPRSRATSSSSRGRSAPATRISSFSNQAGTSAAHYLTAVGEKVRAPCFDTQICLWSGTSFSTPQISGRGRAAGAGVSQPDRRADRRPALPHRARCGRSGGSTGCTATACSI